MAGNHNSGRKGLPANVHMLMGNRSKKSAAVLAGGTRPEVCIPDPPPHLRGVALAEWNRITPLLAAMGVIANQYMAPLAVYCQAWADYVRAYEKIQVLESIGQDGYIDKTPSGYKQMSVHYQIAGRAAEQMKSFGTEFGITPASIAKVSGAAPQGDLFGYGNDKEKGNEKPKTDYFGGR